MWQIRKAQSDELPLAVEWHNAFPDWLRFDDEKTDADFLGELEQAEVFIGINGKPQAIVYAIQVGDGQYEGHLMCSRDIEPDIAVATIMFAKNYLFNQAKASTIIAMVHTRHTTLANIVLRAGFYSTGLKMWKGVDRRGRIFETEQFIVGA
jgi:hypothetical protein